MNESINKVAKFITERGNPYETQQPMKLYNITRRGQVLPKAVSRRLLNYIDGKQRYDMFRKERFVSKQRTFLTK